MSVLLTDPWGHDVLIHICPICAALLRDEEGAKFHAAWHSSTASEKQSSAVAGSEGELLCDLWSMGELSTRTCRCLSDDHNGDSLETIGQLSNQTQWQLMMRKNFGIKSLKEVYAALSKRGLTFKNGGIKRWIVNG